MMSAYWFSQIVFFWVILMGLRLVLNPKDVLNELSYRPKSDRVANSAQLSCVDLIFNGQKVTDLLPSVR